MKSFCFDLKSILGEIDLLNVGDKISAYDLFIMCCALGTRIQPFKFLQHLIFGNYVRDGGQRDPFFL